MAVEVAFSTIRVIVLLPVALRLNPVPLQAWVTLALALMLGVVPNTTGMKFDVEEHPEEVTTQA
jgi:hypothetical protein